MSNSLLHIMEVEVPRLEVDRMQAFLAEAGRTGLEGFAAWAGVEAGNRFFVKKALIPRQIGHRTPRGLYVMIDSDELFRVNQWLYENKMTLIAQVHSHPSGAYHSELDDEIPIATTQGCFSIVVPDFARGPFQLNRCAVFRLSRENQWDQVSPRVVETQIKLV